MFCCRELLQGPCAACRGGRSDRRGLIDAAAAGRCIWWRDMVLAARRRHSRQVGPAAGHIPFFQACALFSHGLCSHQGLLVPAEGGAQAPSAPAATWLMMWARCSRRRRSGPLQPHGRQLRPHRPRRLPSGGGGGAVRRLPPCGPPPLISTRIGAACLHCRGPASYRRLRSTRANESKRKGIGGGDQIQRGWGIRIKSLRGSWARSGNASQRDQMECGGSTVLLLLPLAGRWAGGGLAPPLPEAQGVSLSLYKQAAGPAGFRRLSPACTRAWEG